MAARLREAFARPRAPMAGAELSGDPLATLPVLFQGDQGLGDRWLPGRGLRPYLAAINGAHAVGSSARYATSGERN